MNWNMITLSSSYQYPVPGWPCWPEIGWVGTWGTAPGRGPRPSGSRRPGAGRPPCSGRRFWPAPSRAPHCSKGSPGSRPADPGTPRGRRARSQRSRRSPRCCCHSPARRERERKKDNKRQRKNPDHSLINFPFWFIQWAVLGFTLHCRPVATCDNYLEYLPTCFGPWPYFFYLCLFMTQGVSELGFMECSDSSKSLGKELLTKLRR